MENNKTKIQPKSRTVKVKYSFKQWCEDNNKQALLSRWDYNLNDKSPDEVSFKSNKKFYFKCPRGLHESVYKSIQYLPSGRQQDLVCDKCKSFAQYIIDNRSEEILNYIWSEKNEKSPWEYASQANKKVWLVCEKDSSHVYQMYLDNYMHGNGCPYCAGRKLDSKNNLAALHPEVLDVWSNKYTKSPDQYKFHALDEVWWKCEYGIHEDFLRSITHSTSCNFRCPICAQNYKETTLNDLTHKKFGTLTVISRDESNKQTGTYWICKCDCGVEKSIKGYHLTSGQIKTCGAGIHRTGENGSNWKGGKTRLAQRARSNNSYKEWQKFVYAKDWYTCQCCGRSRDIIKNAHHILNMSSNTELMYDVNNGILMCKQSHYTTEIGSFHNIYGTTDNTPEQLESYINQKRRELNIPLPFSLLEYKQRINILKPNTVEELIQTANNNQNNNQNNK